MTQNKNITESNKKSFYFDDYDSNSKTKKNRLDIKEDRIYLLFFVFFLLF